MTHIWYMLEPPAQFFYIEIAYIQYICSIFFPLRIMPTKWT